MPLTLVPRDRLTLPIDAAGIHPPAVKGQSIEEVAHRTIHVGNEVVELGSVFHLSGNTDDFEIVWNGDLSVVHSIGAGMSAGTMVIHGSVGNDVGWKMTGGVIDVHGRAGHGAGGRMAGGRLWIHGDAGDDLGGNTAGHRFGMRGGTILVDGSAGDRVGAGIRRGMIAVAGDIGELTMRDATAGTVLVFGAVGGQPGVAMRRGTLVLLRATEDSVLPTFHAGRAGQPLFLRILAKELSHAGFAMPEHWSQRRFRTYHGDPLSLGMGEVLIPCE